MEELEKDLEEFDLSDPPPWAKARSLLAAETVLRRQARRSRYKHIAIGLVAAGVSIVVVGTYIADAIAPMLGKGPYMSFPQQEQAVEHMGPQRHMPVVRPARQRAAAPVDTKDAAEDESAEKEDAEEPKEPEVTTDG